MVKRGLESALASLREAKGGSRKRSEQHEDVGAAGIVDEVTEEEYQRLKQQRIEDDFVVDDTGQYVDHGEEIWDEHGESSGAGGSRSTEHRPGSIMSAFKKAGAIGKLASKSGPQVSTVKKASAAACLDSLMESFDNLTDSGFGGSGLADTNASSKSTFGRLHTVDESDGDKSYFGELGPEGVANEFTLTKEEEIEASDSYFGLAGALAFAPKGDASGKDSAASNRDAAGKDKKEATGVSSEVKVEARQGLSQTDVNMSSPVLAADDLVGDPTGAFSNSSVEATSGGVGRDGDVSAEPSFVENMSSSSQGETISAIRPVGRFFVTELCEPEGSNSVVLFGRLFAKLDGGAEIFNAPCSLAVKSVPRNLCFVHRDAADMAGSDSMDMDDDGMDSSNTNSQSVDPGERGIAIVKEFNEARRSFSARIEEFRMRKKFVTRRLPLPGPPVHVTKVSYVGSILRELLPNGPRYSGANYSSVYGAGCSLLETLVIKRGIRGPCWISLVGEDMQLQILKAAASACGASMPSNTELSSLQSLTASVTAPKNGWPSFALNVDYTATKTTLLVDGFVKPKSLGVPSAPDAQNRSTSGLHATSGVSPVVQCPPLTLAVVYVSVAPEGSAVTVREIHAAFFNKQVGVRKIGCFKPWAGLVTSNIPLTTAEKGALDNEGIVTGNEKAVISSFVAKMVSVNPDLIITHNACGNCLDTVLNRANFFDIKLVHRLSRLFGLQGVNVAGGAAGHGGSSSKKQAFVSTLGGMLESSFPGRLVCDTYVAAKEFAQKAAAADLKLQVTKLLGAASAGKLSSGGTSQALGLPGIKQAVIRGRATLEIVFEMAEKMDVLSLTKELASVAGCLWKDSLLNRRSVRNEWLLLHELRTKKVLPPHPVWTLAVFQRPQGDPASGGPKSVSAQGSGPGQAASSSSGSVSVEKLARSQASRASAAEETFFESLDAEGNHEAAAVPDPAVQGNSGDPNSLGLSGGTYSGGLVLEPKVGLYDTYVCLLDFNSLYPSVIQEYNLCFTTVQDPANPQTRRLTSTALLEDGTSSSSLTPSGILPEVLGRLVSLRKEVKALQKRLGQSGSSNSSLYATYEVKQKAYKLIANSMYGCLGFASCRFHCKYVAATVTLRGRQILQDTVNQLEAQFKKSVVYGDTDSLFVDSQLRSYDKAVSLAKSIAQAVNSKYTKLVIEFECAFRSLLLVRKKKYAGLKVISFDGNAQGPRNEAGPVTNVHVTPSGETVAEVGEYDDLPGKMQCSIEVKGIELVRRDWCVLAREVSRDVVNKVLLGTSRDSVLDYLCDAFRHLGEALRTPGAIPISKFAITRGINKLPNQYPDSKSLPHVQVAQRRLDKGLAVKAGFEIDFYVALQKVGLSSAVDAMMDGSETKKEEDEKMDTGTSIGSGSPADPSGLSDVALANYNSRPMAMRARCIHTEVSADFPPDVEWYMVNQLVAMVSRILAPAGLADSATIAGWLGLETTRFMQARQLDSNTGDFDGYDASDLNNTSRSTSLADSGLAHLALISASGLGSILGDANVASAKSLKEFLTALDLSASEQGTDSFLLQSLLRSTFFSVPGSWNGSAPGGKSDATGDKPDDTLPKLSFLDFIGEVEKRMAAVETEFAKTSRAHHIALRDAGIAHLGPTQKANPSENAVLTEPGVNELVDSDKAFCELVSLTSNVIHLAMKKLVSQVLGPYLRCSVCNGVTRQCTLNGSCPFIADYGRWCHGKLTPLYSSKTMYTLCQSVKSSAKFSSSRKLRMLLEHSVEGILEVCDYGRVTLGSVFATLVVPVVAAGG